MNYVRWKKITLVIGIACLICCNVLRGVRAETYKEGQITVKHEALTVKSDGERISFDHPYEITGNVITNALSYIYYEEKGLLKKKETLRVFQDDEIRKLTPFIIQALSVATPKQVVAVLSYSERLLLSDQQNYCILFIANKRLNIVFSRIHTFQTYNDTMSEKKRFSTSNENPVTIKHSRFWKLVPSTGQQLEPDHENWLIIDLSSATYQQPITKRMGTVEEKIEQGKVDLDSRLKKLEEKMAGNVDMSKQAQPAAASEKTAKGESKIKSKLLILRELVSEEIISEEDYNYKKAKMMREGMGNVGVKEQLREIKDLKSEGLITEEDYDEIKKDLLEHF